MRTGGAKRRGLLRHRLHRRNTRQLRERGVEGVMEGRFEIPSSDDMRRALRVFPFVLLLVTCDMKGMVRDEG